MGPLQQEAGLTIIEADLEDTGWYREVLAGHQCCIHAALIWGDLKSEIEGRDASITSQLFESAGLAKVQRAIYVSSLAVHRPWNGVVTERNGFSTTSLYGATKAAGELFFRAACARHEISGVVMRPGPVVGRPAFSGGSIRTPRQLEHIIDQLRRHLPITVDAGSTVQFCDVRALAGMLVKLSSLAEAEPTYLGVDEKFFQWTEIAQQVLAALSSKSEVTVKATDENASCIHFQSDYASSLLDQVPDTQASLFEHIKLLSEDRGACL